MESARRRGVKDREAVLVTVHGGDRSDPGYPLSDTAGAVEPDPDVIRTAIEFFRRVTGGQVDLDDGR